MYHPMMTRDVETYIGFQPIFLILKLEVLGRTNCLLSFDTILTA
jgi:hypothetical protein